MANGDDRPDLVPEERRPFTRRVYPPPPPNTIPPSMRTDETLPTTTEQPRRFAPGETLERATAAPPAPLTLNQQMEQRRGVLKGKLAGPGPEATGWQRFKHGLNVVGQDIGTAYSPAMMEHIPGTIPNMRKELGELTQLQSQEQEREARAEREKEQSAIGEREVSLREKEAGLPKSGPGEKTRDWQDQQGKMHHENAFVMDPSQPTKVSWFDEQGNPSTYPGDQPLPAADTGTLRPTTAAPAAPPVAPPGALAPVGAAAQQPAPMAAPTPPPKISYGKPEKRTEMEEHVDKYLQEHGLPDTSANRDIARQDYTYGPQIGEAKARQYRAQAESMLRDYKIDPAGFVISSTMREPEAKEVLDRAQRAADNARMAAAPGIAEGIKSKHTWGYSATPDGQTIWTNEADAVAKNAPFNPAPPGENAKDRKAIGQIGDVQLNTSRYTKAATDYDAAVTNGVITPAQMAKDQAELHNLLNKAGLFDAKISGILELDLGPITALGEALSREAKSRSYDMLSPQAQNLYNGYLRTVASVPAYVKMLSDVGRTNKETLDLELKNIADPSMGTTAILQYQKNFQENIDRATKRLPNNLPGLEKSMPNYIRQSIEGKAGGKNVLKYNRQTGKLE